MRYSTTDGRVWDVADQCAHCQMDTGGNHQSWCPLSQVGHYEPITNVEITIHPQRETFKETVKRIIRKHRDTLDALAV